MIVKKGSTDVNVYLKIQAGLTATDWDTQYTRSGAAASAKADCTLLGSAGAAHVDNAAIYVDATTSPGLVRLCIPDAAVATGVDEVEVTLLYASGLQETVRVTLVDNIAKDIYDIVNSGVFGNAMLVRSTTPSNTLDVSATGEAGLDFNNIKDATGAHTLTNIRVPNVTLVDTTSDVTNKAGYSLSSAGVQAIWDFLLTSILAVGSIGKLIKDYLDAAVSTRATPAQVASELTTYGALKPTVAGRTLDVSVDGEAGLDWANIGSPGTTQNLSDTTIDTDQVIATVAGNVGGNVLGNVNGNVVGTVASVVGNVGGNVNGNVVGNVNGNVTGSIGSLAAQAKTDVNVEMVDVLTVDTIAELASVPAATTTFAKMLNFLYMCLRNKNTTSTTQNKIHNDAGTVIATAPVSSTLSLYTKDEFV